MNSTRRKLAIATWKAPAEGNIFGKLTVDATHLLAYAEYLRRTTGEKVTVTHLVGKAVANALAKTPSLNGRIHLGRYIPHDTVDVTYLVALEEGMDLAKAKVANADRKSVRETAADLRERAARLRQGKDDDFEKSKGALRVLPTWLLRPILWLTGWLAGSWGLDIPALGVTRFPFGSCVLTSVGMFGLDEGYAPFTPFARVPLLVVLGAVKDRPAVVDGRIVVRPQVTITATIDHRFLDGFQGGVLAKTMSDQLQHPWKLDGAESPPAGLLAAQATPVAGPAAVSA
jgi:pyruvate dehydrogenase E2 component (dihydrolipoamide acetyltransferase)